MVTFTEVSQMDEGPVRIAFEQRTAWTGELIHRETDDGTEHVLHFEGKTDKQNRDFVLASDDEDNVVTTDKPNWGRLVKLTSPRGPREESETETETEETPSADEPSPVVEAQAASDAEAGEMDEIESALNEALSEDEAIQASADAS